MTKSPRRNNIRIAFDIPEVLNFRGRAVVADLFRFSNTVCALLSAGRKEIFVYSNSEAALKKSLADKSFDLFSEIPLESPRRFDNSPYIALNEGKKERPVLIITMSGSKTVMALTKAEEILIGAFSNMPYLAGHALRDEKDILIVPACIFYDRNHIEDFIFAETLLNAFKGKDTFNDALLEIHKSGRILDFLSFRPEGKRDLELILQKGNMRTVPKAEIKGIYAEIKEGLNNNTDDRRWKKRG